jgi:hypothetical protein
VVVAVVQMSTPVVAAVNSAFGFAAALYDCWTLSAGSSRSRLESRCRYCRVDLRGRVCARLLDCPDRWSRRSLSAHGSSMAMLSWAVHLSLHHVHQVALGEVRNQLAHVETSRHSLGDVASAVGTKTGLRLK